MQDSVIPVSRLISYSLWAAVGAVTAAAWATALTGHWQLGLMFGFTACVTSALAAAWQVRCYIFRALQMVLAGIVEGGVQRPVRMRRTDQS